MEKDLQMARQIAQCVAQAGGSTYFVGGYVRDLVLKRDCKDIDLEIHGIAPETLDEILRELGEPVTMGRSFGIMGLRHYGLDIAMPRKDGAGSRGLVNPFVGTRKAASRRDLTMNALMQDVLTGEIVDHFGGLYDLEKGIIRHVDDVTFAEDPLRVLRAAQFAARFGFEVAEETVALSKRLDLSALSAERVWGELEKALLKAERPSVFLEVLRRMGQLGSWFPEVEALIGVEQERAFHPEGDVWNHTMQVVDLAAKLRHQAVQPLAVMTAALCHDLGKPMTTQVIDGRIRALGHEEAGVSVADTFLARMTKEVRLRKYVANMVQLHMRPNIMAAQGSSVKSMCKMYDRSACPEDLLLLAQADCCSRPNAAAYDETKAFLEKNLTLYRERMARPYVMGADLVEAGFEPGTDFKETLDYAHKLRLAGVEKGDALRQSIAYIRKLQKTKN